MESTSQSQPSDQSSNIITTSCRDCVFAVWQDYVPNNNENIYEENIVIEKTQVGCSLGRLAKFREQNLVEDVHDEAREFSIIKRFCNTCRDSRWEHNNKRKNLVELVNKEIKVQIEVYVLVTEEDTPEDVEATLKSLTKQVVKPTKIVVVNNKKNLRPSLVLSLLKGAVTGVPWRNTTVAETLQDGSPISVERAIDITCCKSEAFFFATFRAGFVVPPIFIEELNVALNEELVRFSVLKPVDDRYNGFVAQTKLFNLLEGNKAVTLVPESGEGETLHLKNFFEKVNYFNEDNQNMIMEAVNVCRCLKSTE
jgi:hypothetical protein